MATLTVRTTSRAGINLSLLAVAADVAGDKWAGSGAEILYILNAAVAPITVTLVYNSAAQFDGTAQTNRTVVVPAGNAMLIGPFSTAYYNDANGFVNVTYSAVTTVTVCPFRLGT